MVYGMRWLLRYKYEQALNMFNWPETDLWNVDADVIKEVTRLQHVFLFDSEIFVVPVGRALVTDRNIPCCDFDDYYGAGHS